MCQTFVVSNPKLRLVSFETVIESGLITITLVSAVVNATEDSLAPSTQNVLSLSAITEVAISSKLPPRRELQISPPFWAIFAINPSVLPKPLPDTNF
jgi:hypothetical protein